MPFKIVALVFLSLTASADIIGGHPAFLHALSDLRSARWHLEHRGGSPALQNADNLVIQSIDHCIDEIKKAALDDGKNINKLPGEDVGKDREGHVHRARELLQKAKSDITEREDNTFANGLRDRAVHDIDEALERVNSALLIKK